MVCLPSRLFGKGRRTANWTLEMLKTTYANVRGIPLIGGQFRKISAPPKPNPKKERAYTFQELLKLMLRDVKMGRTGLKSLIGLRNTIIHSAIATKKPSSLWKSYERCQDIAVSIFFVCSNIKATFGYTHKEYAPKHSSSFPDGRKGVFFPVNWPPLTRG